jgi:hypothetical protein
VYTVINARMPLNTSLLVLHTVIRLLCVSAKFNTCTVVRVNGTLVEDKMRRFKGECEHFRFNKCPIYTHDGAGAKFSTNSQEMDNSAGTMKVKVVMSPYEDNEEDCTLYLISARMPLNTSLLVHQNNEDKGCDVSI